VVDDVLVGSEDAVGEPVVAHELPNVFLRVQFRTFAGSGISVMLGGIWSAAERCQPA